MSDLTVPLNSAPEPKKGTFPMWIAAGIFLLTGLVVGVFTYIITKQHFSPDESYNASVAYKVPEIYEANMVLRMPFLPEFQQPIFAQVDSTQNKMRMSYFSGSNVFIFDAAPNATSHSIVPVFDQLECFRKTNADEVNPLPMLFPVMDLFSRSEDKETINGVECDVWEYSYNKTIDGGEWNSATPDEFGYSGKYSFYVNAQTGAPVTFHMQGHNVVIGGSHVDEYFMDYIDIKALDTPLHDSLFVPPNGMACHDTEDPFGPTDKVSAAVTDLRTIFSPRVTEHTDAAFVAWSAEHGKKYATVAEAASRRQIFAQNLRYINTANTQGKSFTMKPNQFADMTPAELRQRLGRRSSAVTVDQNGAHFHFSPKASYDTVMNKGEPVSACQKYVPSGKTLPKSVDWVSKNVVSMANADQGVCGSCWAYGAVGALEGALAIKTGEFKDISQQYLMDCTWRYGNNACEGGLDFMGYSWVLEQNGGKIPGYADYGMPGVGGYLNVNGFCHYYSETTKNPWTEKEIPSVGVMDACYHVNDQWNSTTPVMSDEALVDTLLDALANVGPVSISIAVTPEFYYYSGGIFDQPECESDIESLDHSVLATGYETLADGRVIVSLRNSWSTSWGENGYARVLAKDLVKKQFNVCGVATSPVFPTFA